MPISVFNLFSIGIGPSSSHTVGPMRAAKIFVQELERKDLLIDVCHIKTELFGSLGLTGKGHGTDWAVILGLEGETPDGVDPNRVGPRIEEIRSSKILNVLGYKPIEFIEKKHLILYKGKRLPFHANAMTFTAIDPEDQIVLQKTFYSVGGGFIVEEGGPHGDQSTPMIPPPFTFSSGRELFAHTREQGKNIAEIMLENEKTWRSEEEIRAGLLHIWSVMKGSIARGCMQEGILPGGLGVKRRAADLQRRLLKNGHHNKLKDPSEIFDWISLYALAVNEENAAGGRIVTAPTNGAAGIIPAVLKYYEDFTDSPTEDGIISFLLTAGAIGILYKKGASISGAEMGCQGEVGVACSMAAAGLAAALGASVSQVENAAEIGMEHNLGLTCDPVAGLVQIPCIERNTMGSLKAVNAARLALNGDGSHKVSLDQVIATMKQIGLDMKSIYKETSKGGLAVHVVEC